MKTRTQNQQKTDYSESDLQRALLDALNALPTVRVWRQHAGRVSVGGRQLHLAPQGAADLTGVLAPSGRRIEIEVKRRGGRVSEEQTRWAEQMRALGAVVILAQPQRGETIADVVQRLIAAIAGEALAG